MVSDRWAADRKAQEPEIRGDTQVSGEPHRAKAAWGDGREPWSLKLEVS